MSPRRNCTKQVDIFIFDMISAGIGSIILVLLVYVFKIAYKLTRHSSYKIHNIQSNDKKILLVILLLILSVIFKIIEKLIKAYARLYPIFNCETYLTLSFSWIFA